ncbi:MarR family transcriptional regulator [Actinomycetospora succinea]|uniref:MarR family transcriptional regulator n=1 Tax=Actinomycetospora succinea TaxID=663603 RepID=A0A4R6UW87_9PSEU|nr:MarR family transcriptional regulator [Actinomycetospora succinea]
MTAAVSLAGGAVDAHVLAAEQAAGLTGLRVGHGYVVQLLLAAPHTVGEIARRLGVTQQAASKTVGELVTRGYVARTDDPDGDRRRHPLALTDAGHRAVATARAARADLEDRLTDRVGADDVAAARRVLAALLDELGLGGPVAERRVPPPADRF